MSGVRRNSRSRHERYQMAMQSDPSDLPEYQTFPSRHLVAPRPSALGDARSKLAGLGEIVNKQAYLSTLQEEIEMLKNRIAQMEEEEGEKIARRTISHQQDGQLSDIPSQEGQSRKSQVGRIYVRASTPSTGKKIAKPASKDQQSSYYKWRPQIDERQISDFQPDAMQMQPIINLSPEIKNRSLTNYRVKQKVSKPSAEQKSAISNEDKKQSKKKFKTQKFHSDYHEEKEIKERPKEQKEKQKSVKAKPEQEQVQPEAKPQAKPEPQPQPQPEEPQQLKQVFLSNPEWQITSIHDDFRAKMINKLQIPAGFPLASPKPSQTIEELAKNSALIYKLFKIQVSKCKDLVVRKFKNGVYYQVKPNKNIVWYYTGSFYFGDWDTDLPSEAEKDGFGFEYIPGKYFYLGQFKNGTRNGKGTIKLINPQQSESFLAYDGEWFNGKPHGYGCHIDENNNKYMGAFEHGQKTGKAKVLNHDGLYYEGELRNGLKYGQGMEKLINGDVYTGSYVDGYFHGIGNYTWKNGSAYEGEFSNGKREGKGVWKAYNGDQFQGSYSNDIKNGWGKFSWKNGEIYEGQFKDDMRNGIGSYKHPNGKIGTYFWINGHIDHKIQPNEQAVSSKIEQASTNVQSTL